MRIWSRCYKTGEEEEKVNRLQNQFALQHPYLGIK